MCAVSRLLCVYNLNKLQNIYLLTLFPFFSTQHCFYGLVLTHGLANPYSFTVYSLKRVKSSCKQLPNINASVYTNFIQMFDLYSVT